jgi:hypothetical protein
VPPPLRHHLALTGTWIFFGEATATGHYPSATNRKVGLFFFFFFFFFFFLEFRYFRIEPIEFYIDLFEGFIKKNIFNRKAAT